MGFLGSMLSKGGAEALGLKPTTPMCSFGFGVLFAASGFGVRYFAQFSFARRQNNSWIKAGKGFMFYGSHFTRKVFTQTCSILLVNPAVTIKKYIKINI
jgi:hypothetical protein